MNKLIRSELFRFTHSGSNMKLGIFTAVIIIIMSFLVNYQYIDKTLCENLLSGESGFVMMVIMIFVPLGTVATTVFAYTNKSAYYEIMSGSGTNNILCSKLIVDGGLIWIATQISVSVYFVVVSVKNGIGEGIDNLGVRYLLMTIVILRVVMSSVLIVTALKSFIAGLVAYIRFMFVDMMTGVLLTSVTEFADSAWSNLFINFQLTNIFVGEIETGLVLNIVLGALIEVAMWYIISYVGMKKKMFN